MRLNINDVTQEVTTDCEKGFSCLNGDGKDMCKVKSCVNRQRVLIICPNDNFCYYKKSYGNDNCCTCPVRKEIFNTYKI